MLVHEVEAGLLALLALEQGANGAQPVDAVAVRRAAGLVDAFAGEATGQAQQTVEHAHALDAADLDHGLGPACRLCAEASHLDQQPLGPMLDWTGFFQGNVLSVRAEAAWLMLGMHRDRPHALIEDAHDMAVPASPDLMAQVLRRHGIEGLGDLDMTITMHGAAAFLEPREASCRQWLQARTFDLVEQLADLLPGGAVH